MASLAVKYRPQTFEEVVSQRSIIEILKKQIETKTFKNCYLFSGPSGCGKTTLARIFAYKINEYKDSSGNICSSEPIEIDGASNNGVDNIKAIIQSARERSLDGKYKIYILDEVHMLTIQSWNALLKTIEEPPEFTIFLFCTTDPQKIPATILNRVMRFNLNRLKVDEIEKRLNYICEQERFTNYKESCNYISKLACGGMRDGIALLEKCAGYSNDLNIDNVLTSLGNFSYEVMFDLTNSIIDNDEATLIKIVEFCYNEGNDLKLFISQYLDFILDLGKYNLLKSMQLVKIPSSLMEDINYTLSKENISKVLNVIMDEVLDLNLILKTDLTPKTTITIKLLQTSRKIRC